MAGTDFIGSRSDDSLIMNRVLLVSNEMAGLTSRLWDALEADRLEVRWCPGPQAPTYVCAGGRNETCALPCRSDIVVLDCFLDSDIKGRGTSSRQLLDYYVRNDLPVVALVDLDEPPLAPSSRNVVTLPRDADPEEISKAVVCFTDAVARRAS